MKYYKKHILSQITEFYRSKASHLPRKEKKKVLRNHLKGLKQLRDHQLLMMLQRVGRTVRGGKAADIVLMTF